MKKTIVIITLAVAGIVNAQVIIGDATGTASVKTSVLLEFAAGNKGIIVPYVRLLPANPVEGTIVLDASTPATARMKYYNGGWVDLSGQDADLTAALGNQPAGITETGKSIIGAQTSTADGVLVLESTTKAMVLPIVADVQNIPNPSPGMMVYVNKDGAKRLAIFNGSKWSFWKAPATSTNGSGVVSSYSCNTASAGFLVTGSDASGVTQTITATVTSLGSYNISASANGVTFKASDTFTTTGAQDIVLNATGRPINQGQNTFTLNTDPGCSFVRNVGGPT